MKLYIAGASKEPERVRAMMEAAEALGFELTLDWLHVIEVEQGGAANPACDVLRRRFARDDLRAVREADIVWVLAPENASTGSWCELQHAIDMRDWVPRIDRRLGLLPLVLVSGPARLRCIFASLADYEYDTDEVALGFLRGLIGGRV